MKAKTPAEQKLYDRLVINGEYALYQDNTLVGPITSLNAAAETITPAEVAVIKDLGLGNRISREAIDTARSNAHKAWLDQIIASL